MKKLFLFLLKMYSKTESERLEIHEILSRQVEKTYYEQNSFGNVYNSSIEFIMANPLIRKLVREKDEVSLKMIEHNIIDSIPVAFQFLRNEEIKDKRRKKLKDILKINN